MPADRAPGPAVGPGRPGVPAGPNGADGPARTPRARPGRLTPPRRIGAAAGARRPGTFPGAAVGGRQPAELPQRHLGRAARAAQLRARRVAGLDVPRTSRGLQAPRVDPELFGKLSERFARFMGTASFLFYMTMFVGVWLAWNTFAPAQLQFDPRALNYTLLTLILSLQASYAAPLILLAQNRQDDRDRVSLEQDRQRGERSLADTEYLARELVALRIALRDVATRDFVRAELRDLLAELEANGRPGDAAAGPDHAEGDRAQPDHAGREPAAGAPTGQPGAGSCREDPRERAQRANR